MLLYKPTIFELAFGVTDGEEDDEPDIFGNTAEKLARLDKADQDYDLWVEDNLRR